MLIILVTLYGFYPLGVGNGDADATFFKNVEHGNPILARGLHTNINAVVFVKPIGETVKIGIVSGKTFLLVVRLYSVSSRDNRSDQKRFCERLRHSKSNKQLSKISLLGLRYEERQ